MKQKKAKLMLSIVISAVATVFLYIVLHEFGHTIVMLSAESIRFCRFCFCPVFSIIMLTKGKR